MDLGVVPLSADRLPQPSWPDAKPWDRVLARVQDVIAALSASGSPATADRVRTLAGASDQLVILLSRDRVNLQLLVGGRVVPLDSASKEAILAFVRMESAGADAPQAGAPTQNSLADAAREADVQAQIRDGLGASLPQGAGLPAGASAALSGAFALPPGASPQELARLLTAAFAQSGLFLESHVAQWFLGKRSLRQMSDDVANLPEQFSRSDGSERRSAVQFDAMQRQGLMLEGEDAFRQPVQLELTWKDESPGGGSGPGRAAILVAAEVTLNLPRLGKLQFTVRARDGLVGIQIGAEDPASFLPQLGQLDRAIRAHGIDLAQLSLSAAEAG